MADNPQSRIEALAVEIRRLEQELAHGKRAEEEQRRHACYYRSIFEHADIGFAQIGPDDRVR